VTKAAPCSLPVPPAVSSAGSPTAPAVSPAVSSTASPTASPVAPPTVVSAASLVSPAVSPTVSPAVPSTASPTVSPVAPPTVVSAASLVSPAVSPTVSPAVPSTASPTVSVVVPVRDGARTLARCLAGLAAQDRPPDEVIVVDNGSRDGSGELARAFGARTPALALRVVEEPRPGASVARNRGVAAASGDLVAFTDADCEPAPPWLGRLAGALGPGVGAVAGRVRPAPPRSAIEAFAALYTLRTGELAYESSAFTLLRGGFPTANLAVRREVFDALGGFDETVRIYGEDYDLCARLYGLGQRIRYEPEAVVFHHHRTTLRGLLRQSFGFGACHAYLLRRHFRRKVLVELPAAHWERDDLPARLWLDLASADKKLLALALAAVAWPPAGLLLLGYVGYLYLDASRRFRREAFPPPPAAHLAAPALLVLKSAAITAGRLVGSVRFGALCL
jgi:GT2 family glycosyltransferase